MRKCILILSFSLAFGLTGLCQQYIARLNIDSLKTVLLIAKDTQRINTLNLLARRILFGNPFNGFLDSATYLTSEAMLLSNELKYVKGLGNALLNQSDIHIRSGKSSPSTLSDLQMALPLLKQAGDWYSVAGCFNVMGECYHFFGKNKEAIQACDSAIYLFQHLGDTITSAWTMIDKAHSYSDLGDFASSYKTFHTAQELTPKTDTLLTGFTWCELAQLFVWANLPELAIEYMHKLTAFYQTFNPSQKKNLSWQLNWISKIGGEAFLQINQTDSALKIAHFLNIPFEQQAPPANLFYGHLYLAMKDYQKALRYFNQGYKTSVRTAYQIGHSLHANGLASTWLKLKDYQKALYYAQDAMRISKKMPSLVEQKNAAGILSELYADTKNYTKAFYYNQLYKSLNDSLAPEEYKRKLSLIQVRDQLELQKKEAELLSNQNQLGQQRIKIQESSLKQRSLLLYFFLGAFLVMIVLVILINRNIKLKRRKAQLQVLMEQVSAQQKLTELEKEKSDLELQALRAQMNPHFIFNCLSSINRYILINKPDEASDYLTKFSRLIRMALHNSEKPLITLESELESLRLYLDLERLRFKNAFSYRITFINAIDCNTVHIPPMLIQPFVENAIWHGLMHKRGTGSLEIQLCVKDKILTCVITDNGIGRNMAAALKTRSAEKSKSMGVDITAGRLAILNKSKKEAAVFSIEDLLDEEGKGCGTRVVLTMPCKSLIEVA